MITIKHILCPTDLSPASDEALRYAVALARAYEAKLFVCHCLESGEPVTDALRQSFGRQVEAAIRQWTGIGHCPPADYEGIIVQGAPEKTIPRLATEHHIDLIVMRSRQHAGAVVLGSTTEAVCRAAPCSVLVTHPHEREWVGLTTCEIDLQKVLVAQDFSASSELALRWGLSLSQEYQAELHLLHVLPVTLAPALTRLPFEVEDEFQRAARLLAKSIPDETHLWCTIFQAVKAGRASGEILDYAAEHQIDLICLGAHGTGGTETALFGSNTDRVLRRAPCPVLIARPLTSSKGPDDRTNEEFI